VQSKNNSNKNITFFFPFRNPSFTPQDPELPELPTVDIESTAASTLADLTKLIDDKPSTSSNTLNKLSRFLNPDILKKKPTISNIITQSNTMIDLTDTKKVPTVKSTINISLGKFIKKILFNLFFFVRNN
jgi:hypothetical protein